MDWSDFIDWDEGIDWIDLPVIEWSDGNVKGLSNDSFGKSCFSIDRSIESLYKGLFLSNK
jgi:hypothetical protein